MDTIIKKLKSRGYDVTLKNIESVDEPDIIALFAKKKSIRINTTSLKDYITVSNDADGRGYHYHVISYRNLK